MLSFMSEIYFLLLPENTAGELWPRPFTRALCEAVTPMAPHPRSVVQVQQSSLPTQRDRT